MTHRARTTAFLVLLVGAVWFLAFLAYDYSSRLNAWNTYREVGGQILATCIFIVLIASSLLVARSGLLPGRLVASVIIGLFAATYILPVTTMSPTRRKRLYTEDRFLGFQERTVQYAAVCLPVVIGVTISSRRKRSSAI
jgi:TRAP-type mannitol/chloroaromatic compound transport system permease large subunit